MKQVQKTNVRPEDVNGYLESVGTAAIVRPERISKVALRPQVNLADLLAVGGVQDEVVTEAPGAEVVEELVEIELKYAGYLAREEEMAQKMMSLEDWAIPDAFDYASVSNITLEAREKLSKIQPNNLGQASRISGVSPADISVLMVLLKKAGGKDVAVAS